MPHDLTRWIEEAEARRFSETLLDGTPSVGESHYIHLGDAIAKLPSWFRRTTTHETLSTIGCALSHLRHLHEVKPH